ncbi:hypothetical protein [Rhodoblastus sp.]|jgi:hypothetical protein|uniref:hypothetical protein n=1 Tax=Rhodoblastus sp. TaxID=1962975 RepID=UPI0025DF2DA8|nr:hypothetical protein [Rhodoblastus sp.]
MNQPALITVDRVPAVIAAGGEKAAYCFLEFFKAPIRNHTRRAYARAAGVQGRRSDG